MVCTATEVNAFCVTSMCVLTLAILLFSMLGR